MGSIFINNIIRFVAILGLQVFLFNDPYLQGSTTVGAHSWLKPQFYILFILMLPINLNRNFTVLISFITGLVMDMFCNTYGLHASACLVLALVRPILLDRLFQSKLKENNKTLTPSLSVLGVRSFLIYTLICTIIYNIYFYIIKVWSFQPSKLFFTFMNIVVGIIISMVLFFIAQAFFVSRGRKKRSVGRY